MQGRSENFPKGSGANFHGAQPGAHENPGLPRVNPSKKGKLTVFDPLFLNGPIFPKNKRIKNRKSVVKGPNFFFSGALGDTPPKLENSPNLTHNFFARGPF